MRRPSVDNVVSPAQILRAAAARFADKPARVTADRTVTFRELDTESDRIAAALAARGVQPGRPVSLYAQNWWEWAMSYHSALKAGAVVNPVNVMLTPEELAFVLHDCDSAAVFTSSEQAAGVLDLTGDLPGSALVIAFDEPPEGSVGFAELLARNRPPPPSFQIRGREEVRAVADLVATEGFPSGPAMVTVLGTGGPVTGWLALEAVVGRERRCALVALSGDVAVVGLVSEVMVCASFANQRLWKLGTSSAT